jgi:transposase
MKSKRAENRVKQIAVVKRELGAGKSQLAAAKQAGVSNWTVTQWKNKGLLGGLPKGRIPKGQAAKVIASGSTSADLSAEVIALRAALKALVPAAKLAAYKAKLEKEAREKAAAAAAL